MHHLEQYLGQVRYTRGPGVAETSTYSALEALFNAVGEALDPPVEVKGPAADVHAIARGEQVTRYHWRYRQVLVTNLRQFVLMGLNRRGEPVELESYALAASEDAFEPGMLSEGQVAQVEAAAPDDATILLDNLRRYQAGEPLRNVEDKYLGY